MKKIVIVEDEAFMREELVSILEKEEYKISCITNFENAVEEILKECPDLVLLDLNLPGITGFEICKGLRQKSTVPILVLTSRDKLKDELHALGLGADEYLNKPCHKERLLARISNLLRRFEDRENFLELKGIKLDVQTYTMYVKGTSLVLPENQGKIMELLLSHSEEIVTKEMLFKKLWGTTEFVDENALQVNITRLKKTIKKLEIDYKITNIRGKGYCIEAMGEKYNG
ncbi:DNA-binding response regulator, OmpR family, contains REC and winged-helix (wHTH) domain [Clostridium collagenovorans DSM 3089]|uniref:Stage 0 sporulation protein A homolog n=1 Tax=Clostridium collagenovorans DSM 3089 TaxID=1121306 RepID=A0A1M5V188_9CLOT|nr:response regulator transcription factor [Clostridium collagenovorans]SHH68858.1 DNA-binding response regulator, OmpR family, contains REC and winged-helix (wHTH) domain [Clostridium collagenovorans DSM 3089]